MRFTRPTGPWMTRSFFELTFIVLGVLFGLMANEWRESRDARREADQALRRIHAELIANREYLDRRVAYHRAMSDSLPRLVLSAEPGGQAAFSARVDSMGFAEQGFNAYPVYVTAAWDLARTSDVLDPVDYDTLYWLARLYEGIERVRRAQQGIGPATTAASEYMFVRGENEMALLVLAGAVNDLAFAEGDVLAYYEEVLARLDLPADSARGEG